MVHQFNKRMFIRAIVQYQDIRRDVSLDDDPTLFEPREKNLLTELLFTYKVNAPTALYLGYTDRSLGTNEYGLTQAERTFFFKVGYAWVP